MIRVGIGYDAHVLAEGRKLILGGVEISHPRGLEGHSDADVLIHAICDAILGAIGEGDIGSFFPNSDARWRDASSIIFLEEAARQVLQRRGRIINIDSTLIAEKPRLLTHMPEMKKNLSKALQIEITRIGIKATTNEGMGFAGREEGIAAMAVASVDLPE